MNLLIWTATVRHEFRLMDISDGLSLGFLLLVVVIAAALVLWYRHRTKRTMQALEKMLDDAIRGTFTEECFDESMRSAVESQLAQYLQSSAISARNLQSEKDKIKSLIADISHQTKLPIANVLLYTQLLAEQDLPQDCRSYIAALESQAEKLQMLIEALVKTSRLETGIIALNPQRSTLEPVLQAAAMQLQPKADANGIDLTLGDCGGDAVFDPKWTEEAVFNLLDNAVKYTPRGGTVTVATRLYPLFACITVTDTGPGIPESQQPKVFQRFYRGPQNQSADGVGIGLYLVRQIAEGQGGYVKVSSPPEGGAMFSLFLPRN